MAPFTFTSTLLFETPEDKEQIRERGLLHLHQGGVSAQAQELGLRYAEELASGYSARVCMRFVNEQIGQGLFAQAEIPAGSYVGEYVGIVRKNNRRYFEPLNNYCYEYPVLDETSRSYVIDATVGNLTRFINHSYTPNLQPVHVFLDGFYHLIFLCLCPIKAGTQLCYNYGRNYWYIRPLPQDLNT